VVAISDEFSCVKLVFAVWDVLGNFFLNSYKSMDV